jgi:hypothetical protein
MEYLVSGGIMTKKKKKNRNINTINMTKKFQSNILGRNSSFFRNLITWRNIRNISLISFASLVISAISILPMADFDISLNTQNVSIECCGVQQTINLSIDITPISGIKFIDFFIYLEAPPNLGNNSEFEIIFLPKIASIKNTESRIQIKNKTLLSRGIKRIEIVAKGPSNGPFGLSLDMFERKKDVYINVENCSVSDFNISLNRKIVESIAGNNNNYLIINVGSFKNYCKTVKLDVEPECRGVQFILNKTEGIPPYSSLMLINTTTNAEVGNRSFSIYGIGDDHKEHESLFYLNILENDVDFSMELNPRKLKICPGEDKKFDIEFNSKNVYDGLINLSFESNNKDLEVKFNPQTLRTTSNLSNPKVTAEIHANSSINDGIYNIYISGIDKEGLGTTCSLEVEISDNDFDIEAIPENLTLKPGEEKEINITLEPNCYNSSIELEATKPSFIEFDIDPKFLELSPQEKAYTFAKLTVKPDSNDFGNHIIEIKAIDDQRITHDVKRINFYLMKFRDYIPIVAHPLDSISPIGGNANDTLTHNEVFEQFELDTRKNSQIITEFAADTDYSNSKKLNLILDCILTKDVASSRLPCDPKLTVWILDKNLGYKPLSGCNGLCSGKLENFRCSIPGDPETYIIDGKIRIRYDITDTTNSIADFYIDYQSVV